MALDLIYCRNDIGVQEQVADLARAEIRDADCSGAAAAEDLLHLEPGVQITSGNRPVDQIEIHVIQTETFEASIESFLDVPDPLGGIPDLCRDEKLFSRNSAVHEGVSEFHFIFVYGGSIEQAITYAQRIVDRAVHGILVGDLKEAESEIRHGSAGI